MSEENETTFGLSDEAILHLVKLLQFSILTGTDIVDTLRTMQFETTPANALVVTETSRANLDAEIAAMIERVPELLGMVGMFDREEGN